MKRTVQSVLMLVALWGALLTIALREGWEMPRWLTPERTSKQVERTANSPPPPAHDQIAPAAPEPSTPQMVPAPEPATAPRYRVCASEAPNLSTISLLADQQQLAVHCGDHIDVLHTDSHDAPTRIATLDLPTPNPGEHFRAAPPVSADINADGRIDLIVPVLTVDAWQHAMGRSVVSLLRDPTGGFRAATRITAASPLAVATGRLDAQAGTDFVVLHATQQSVKKPREAWWFSGGVTPRRTATSPLPPSAEQIALADLDRDGHEDLIALTPSESRIDVIFGNGDGTAADTVQLSVTGCEELLVADLSGDGHADVACSGASTFVIDARGDRALAARALSLAGERVRSLHTADMNADGKLDLVGYAHPQVVRLSQAEGDRMEPQMVAELQGAGFSPLSVVILDLDHDGSLDLVMLGRGPSDPAGTDLTVVHDIERHTLIRVSEDAVAVGDAPLMLTLALQ